MTPNSMRHFQIGEIRGRSQNLHLHTIIWAPTPYSYNYMGSDPVLNCAGETAALAVVAYMIVIFIEHLIQRIQMNKILCPQNSPKLRATY